MMRTAIRLLGLSATLTFAACGNAPGADAWLERAEAAHAKATERIGRGDVAGARAELRAAADAPAPRAAAPDDARVVRQDLYYRLATLELEQRRAREASAAADAGLALGRGADVFTANLLIARGQAEQALGDAPAASRDYHAALLVSEALLDRSLGGSGSNR